MSEDKKSVPVEAALEKYSDADFTSLGLPTPGSLNGLRVVIKQLLGTPIIPQSIAFVTKYENGQKIQVRNTDEYIAGTMFAFVLKGKSFGFDAMQSMEAFWPSPDGRVGMYSKSMMALMRKAGIKFDWHQRDTKLVDCTGKRADGETFRASFGQADADRAKLSQRATYMQYPTDMYTARVVGSLFRNLGADIGMGGPVYTPEELQDTIDMSQDQAGSYSAKPDDTGSYNVEPKKAAAPATVDVKPEVLPPEKEKPKEKATTMPTSPAAQNTFSLRMVADTAGGGTMSIEMPNEATATEAKALFARAKELANLNHTIIEICEALSDGTVRVVGNCTPDPKAETKPAAEPEAKEKATKTNAPERNILIAKLQAMVPLTGIAEKTAFKRFDMFFSGYTGLSTAERKTKPQEYYDESCAALKVCLERDAPSFATPEKAGESYRKIRDGIESWAQSVWNDALLSTMTVDLNYHLGVGLGTNPEEAIGGFRSFIEANGLHAMQPADAAAVMRAMQVTRKGGAKLAGYTKKYGILPSVLLASLEKEKFKAPIIDVKPEDAERIILQVEAELSDLPKAPEVIDAEPVEEEGGDSQFGLGF